MISRTLKLRLALTLSFFALTSNVLAAEESWHVRDIKTSISFNRDLLRNLGVDVRDVREQAVPIEHHRLSVSAGTDLVFSTLGPLGLNAQVKGHSFERLTGGALVHRGGFDLVSREGRISLQGFQLNAGVEPRTFELRTAQGDLLFTADLAHFEVDREKNRIRIFNMDLRFSEWLARAIGEEAFAGVAVGVLALDAQVIAGPAGPADAPIAGGPPPCSDFTGTVDVALINMASVGQTERSGGIVTVTPSATLKNVGTANVPWHAKFSGSNPPYNNDQHPFLVWSMYRIADGVIEQLGVSHVKQAFLTINNNCDPGACTIGSVLGLGCEDVYSQGTNISNNSLSLRHELTAGAGLWSSTGSHFDQNSDGNQDHPASNPDPSMFHRLRIQETDLQTPSALYYFEGWYIVRDDVNIFNNMGYKRLTPTQSGGGNWTFTLNTSLAQGSVLDAWVDPITPPAGSKNQLLTLAEGEVRLAVKTTDLGGGLTRYEYALMNHDFDRQIGSFSIPVNNATISNTRFRDIDTNASNDWTVAVTPTTVTWTKPAAIDGIDYGMMFNFAFTADSPAVEVNATMTAVEPGSPSTLEIGSLGPEGMMLDSPFFADGFETGDSSAWSSVSP